MSSHYISTNRNKGMRPDDFTQGTASTAGDQIELRVLDGASVSRKDVLEALDRIRGAVTSPQQVTFLA